MSDSREMGHKSTKRVSFQELKEHIVDLGRCSGCAACVVSCPRGALGYVDEKPLLTGECDRCGLCVRGCFRFNPACEKIDEMRFGRSIDLEEAPYGTPIQIIGTRLLDERTLSRCQDGGAVTGLLQHALETGFAGGALVAGRKRELPLLPLPRLVTRSADLVSCSGSCYTYSANLLPLMEKENLPDELILVGTPCQINAVRQWQATKIKAAKHIKMAIALFCTESFEERFLSQKLAKDLGIKLSEVAKIDIKGKMMIHLNSGEIRSLPLEDAKQYSREGCRFCTDFSGRYGDISVGGIGGNGWSITVVRSELGEALLKSATAANVLKVSGIENFPISLKLLERMSRNQLHRPKR
jgi:coenzyme F420 hydrogenase subunit beta